jgi:serine/threonine-protein kinase
MAITVQQFIERLTQSGLMSAAELAAFHDSLPPAERPRDVKALVAALYRAGKLTKYQAQAVYDGKTKGLVFGEYVVLDKLGEGGMGVVLKAQHRRMKRTVAVKMIAEKSLGSPDAVRRFYREVEAAAKLMHPNIVAAHDASEHNGVHYLVMEYVEGKDLAAIVKDRGPMAVHAAVECTLQAARGLQYAHDKGIVHRDIKPSNLLMDKDGTVKILDMGLARIAGLADDSGQDRLTGSGQVMGTCDYMSPEQALDSHAADHRTDIYALGCTLHRLLTGHPPYRGETLMQILLAHQQAPIPSLSAARPDVPAELDELFQRMVAKQPEDRYQSMTEVVAELEAVLAALSGQPVAQPSEGPSSAALAQSLAFLQEDRNVSGTLRVPLAPPTRQKKPAPGDRTPPHVVIPTGDGPGPSRPSPVVRRRSSMALQWLAPVVRRPSSVAFAAGGLVVLLGIVLAITLRNRTPATADLKSQIGDLKSEIPPLAVAPFDAEQARKHQEAWARYLGVPVEITNSIGMKLLLIPPGEFMMGEGGDAHKVRITKPFYLGKHEVTQEEWEAVMGLGNNPSQFKRPKNPVEMVTWEDCQVFFRKLMEREKETRTVARSEYRLPTEAQWEYACRAGSTGSFCFGDSELGLDDYGWYEKNSEKKTHPVGQKKPNAWGLYDIHGNVWEWCADWYDKDYYKVSPPSDPVGSSSGPGRVYRGGCWDYDAGGCRSAYRSDFGPGSRCAYLGLRVSLVLADTAVERAKLSPTTDAAQPSGVSTASKPSPAVAPFDTQKAKEHQAAWAKHLGLPLEITNSIGMKLVLIPPGEFTMGSPKELIEEELKTHAGDAWYTDHLPGEGPQHRVRITRPFYLGTYLVTQGEYERVMASNPSEFSATGKGKDKVAGQETKRFPVEMVSWDEAVEFCRKLSDLPAEKAAGRTYLLPSEAQWEYACRAGSTGRYGFSTLRNMIPGEHEEKALLDYGWFADNAGGMPHAVGLKRASAWGLYDMYGNVWEWCQDWYDKGYYASSPTDDPTGPPGGPNRVSRGGCWADGAGYCRSADRARSGPGDRYSYLGLRVSRVLADK